MTLFHSDKLLSLVPTALDILWFLDYTYRSWAWMVLDIGGFPIEDGESTYCDSEVDSDGVLNYERMDLSSWKKYLNKELDIIAVLASKAISSSSYTVAYATSSFITAEQLRSATYRRRKGEKHLVVVASSLESRIAICIGEVCLKMSFYTSPEDDCRLTLAYNSRKASYHLLAPSRRQRNRCDEYVNINLFSSILHSWLLLESPHKMPKSSPPPPFHLLQLFLQKRSKENTPSHDLVPRTQPDRLRQVLHFLNPRLFHNIESPELWWGIVHCFWSPKAHKENSKIAKRVPITPTPYKIRRSGFRLWRRGFFSM